jgi:hypothetical protein
MLCLSHCVYERGHVSLGLHLAMERGVLIPRTILVVTRSSCMNCNGSVDCSTLFGHHHAQAYGVEHKRVVRGPVLLSQPVLGTIVKAHPFRKVLLACQEKLSEQMKAAEGNAEKIALLKENENYVQFQLKTIGGLTAEERAIKMLRVLGFDEFGQRKLSVTQLADLADYCDMHTILGSQLALVPASGCSACFPSSSAAAAAATPSISASLPVFVPGRAAPGLVGVVFFTTGRPRAVDSSRAPAVQKSGRKQLGPSGHPKLDRRREQQRRAAATQRAKRADEINERQRAARAANLERYRGYDAARDPETYATQTKASYDRNPEPGRAAGAVRYANAHEALDDLKQRQLGGHCAHPSCTVP